MAQTAAHLMDYALALPPRRSPGTNSPPDCLCPGSALANERVQTNAAGQVVLKLKTPWRDGTTHQGTPPLEFMQRLAALVPRPLAGRVGPAARLLARHKQSTGLFVSGLGGCT